jgi:hypothetical protein
MDSAANVTATELTLVTYNVWFDQHHLQKRCEALLRLVRASTPGWQPKSIELLGTTPISPDYPNIFPSDHFGLVGRLEWTP